MPRREGWGPREHLISELCLPTKVEIAFRRWGFTTVEELMGRDPWDYVMPLGPDPYWIEEVEQPTYGGGVRTAFYRRELDLPNREQGFRMPLEPWLEVRRIGITSIIQTLEAIALWQEENRGGLDRN